MLFIFLIWAAWLMMPFWLFHHMRMFVWPNTNKLKWNAIQLGQWIWTVISFLFKWTFVVCVLLKLSVGNKSQNQKSDRKTIDSIKIDGFKYRTKKRTWNQVDPTYQFSQFVSRSTRWESHGFFLFQTICSSNLSSSSPPITHYNDKQHLNCSKWKI